MFALMPRHRGEGFTMIELIAVLLISGILVAIGLPTILNYGNRARQTEARQHVSTILRAEQVYYMEKGNVFARNLTDLAIGLPVQTSNYTYNIDIPNSQTLIVTATNRKPHLKIYSAGIFATPGGTDGGYVTVGIICESNGTASDLNQIPPPPLNSDTCPDGYHRLDS
jgi:prepilin-type N-terminal cleavage/methylation domain-containing protein